MDENRYLILLNGEDKTGEIESYEKVGRKIRVQYHRNFKMYEYNLDKVVVKVNPTVINIVNKSVYHQDMPLSGIEQLLNFNGIAKVIFKNKKSSTYSINKIRVDTNSISTPNAQRTLDYWRQISNHTSTGEGAGEVLKKAFQKLVFVSPQSVLGSYINKEPLKYLSPSTSNIIFPFNFNLSQKDALDHALKSNISVIEGPPGTGKTQTILNIISNLAIMQGKSVAIVSSNNSAVKNVKDKLEKSNYDFFVASLGNMENQKSFFENLPRYENFYDDQITLNENDLMDKISKLNNQIHYLMGLDNEKARVQQELAAYQVEKRHFDHYYESQKHEQITQPSFFRITPEKIISFLAEYTLTANNNKEDRLIYKVKLLFKYGFSNFKTLKEKQIDMILNLQQRYYELKIKSFEKEKANLQKELDRADFNQLLKQHQEYSSQLFKYALHKKYQGKPQIVLNRNTYKKNFKTFIDRFPVVLSTTHSLRNCIPENYLFDYVIIDEASQVDLVSGVLALSCCKNVIIVGDTKQLPQIVNMAIQSNINVENIDEPYNYFKHNVLSSMLALYGTQLSTTLLKEHYRCHPKIIEFCNQKYYKGELIPFTEEKEDDQALILYRTSEGNHMRELTHSKGKFNQRELDVIIHEVLHNPNFSDDAHNNIGFVTPYRKQVEKAINTLGDNIESDTIHKYQGREKPIMIMSTVLDQTRFGKIGISFVDDPRMINVAVSRAQKCFVLVTDHLLFSKYGREVSDLIRYMEYNTLDRNIIHSEVVSVFDLLYREFSNKLISLNRRLVNKSKFKSENIMWTLLEDILNEEKYNCLEFRFQILLKNLINYSDKLDEEEQKFINHRSSVDFIIYYKLNRKPLLAIEVDGYSYHENNSQQLLRDKLKNSILSKHDLPLIRFPTTGSNEEQIIRKKLDEVLSYY